MKNFRIQVIVRVLSLSATAALAVLLILTTQSYVAATVLTGAAVTQIVLLIGYVDKTNREVARFLRSVRYADFSQTFSARSWGRSFRDLHDAISDVMDDFREARSESEQQSRFLHTVIQHVGIGLISFRPDGSVGLINNAAKRLLNVRFLKNVAALRSFSPDLVRTMMEMRAGDRAIVKVVNGDEMLELAVYATRFKMGDESFTLVSVQDIQTELEEKEIEAWQKLTRVLTHEIMNSITPIASLAGTVHELVEEGAGRALHEDAVRDIRDGVATIERRSQSLLHFVQAYRSLTRIPRPDLQIFPASELFASISRLFRSEMQESGIELEIRIDPENLTLTADQQMIEQILINLLRNAAQALEGRDDGRIQVSAYIGERSRAVVQVSDNGPGIEKEAMDKIFIPFFSTKKEGSGIGLSLSRQIMRQHGGTISVVSDPGTRTTFRLRF
ncbi:MAG: ATP-binding protein [Rhodothermales bacterium]|nr:ATP-binding protein [Rhodothermales bacterium]